MAARHLTGVLALFLLAASACSKTQDTAPQRRFFGSAPVIETTSVATRERPVSCDVSTMIPILFCSLTIDVPFKPDGQPDPECMFNPEYLCKGIRFRLYPADPRVVISGAYTEVRLEARVTDAESTADKTDILLTTGSFVVGDQEESVILFDDGSSSKFPFAQEGTQGFNCTIDAKGFCGCVGVSLPTALNSNDLTAKDSLYSRGLAFFNLGGSDLGSSAFQICIAQQTSQAPKKIVAPGTTLKFRIDAVDNSGNVTTSPKLLEAPIKQNSFTCVGDPCGCCLFTSEHPTFPQSEGGCSGKDGMIGTVEGTDFEFCKTF